MGVVDLADASVIGYEALFVSVLVGSTVFPLIPTGVVVAAAAVYATTSGEMSLPLVIALSTISALLGDLVTFGAAKTGRGLALRWITRGASKDRLATARAKFAARGGLIIVVGRLVPAGRIPVLLAAGTLGYPWRRLAPVALVACVVWAVAYAALGIASGALFDDPDSAVLLVALLGLAIGLLTTLVTAWRRRRQAIPRESR